MVKPPFKLNNSPTYLLIPTYDGSGQAIHPDIIEFRNGFKGGLSKKYTHILAFTPYPNGNDDYENPSVVVSNTPTTEFVEDNIQNPIDFPEPPRYNSDTDIVFHNGTFYLFYRDYYAGVFYLRLRKSKDLVNWSDEITLNGIVRDLLSPAIIYDEHEGKFKMWGVSREDRTVEYYESDDGVNWHSRTFTDIPQYLTYNGIDWSAWHIDVQKMWLSKKYYALIVYHIVDDDGHSLFFAESDDGIHWLVYDEPVLSPGQSGSWDDYMIYRSTFIIEEGYFKCWYSARNVDNVWHTGYTETPIDFVRIDDVTLNVVDYRPKIPTRLQLQVILI